MVNNAITKPGSGYLVAHNSNDFIHPVLRLSEE